MAQRFRSYGYQDLAYSMYEGLREAYSRITSNKPDLLVAPLRGAEPLLRGIQAMADSDGRSNALPPYVFLEIGEAGGRPADKDWTEANRRRIENKLGAALKGLGKEDADVMMLDETQHGVAFGRNYRQIKEFLNARFPKARLRAIAISDCMKTGMRMSDPYLAGEDISVIGVKRLISMDQEERLPNLWWDMKMDHSSTSGLTPPIS
ncbi:MAG: hypothetical protein PHG85_04805 [Candidatus Altiarchaeota archaeon]|nr:hypothetical protein [Candidatus Altiarchaeota archaeon]